MATKKDAPYGVKADGTPRKKPGPKKVGKAAKQMPRHIGGKRPARKIKTIREMREQGLIDAAPQVADLFADVDRKFMSAVVGLAAGARWVVEDARPEFYEVAKEGRPWEPSISAMLPDGLDLRQSIRWVADNLHPGDVRTYVLRAGAQASLEFALNEKGERIPRPAVVFKSLPRKVVEPGSPAAVLDAMKQMINARSAIGIIADWGMTMAKSEIVDAATDARQAIDALTKTYSASPEEIEKAMGELAPNLRKSVLSVVSGMNDKEKDLLRKRGFLRGDPPDVAPGFFDLAQSSLDEIRAEAARSGNGPEARPTPPDAPTANECRTED